MKSKFILVSTLLSCSSLTFGSPSLSDVYAQKALSLQLDQNKTWQRLLYANKELKSEVTYTGFFYAKNGQNDLKQELEMNVQALFDQAEDNQSIRCKFPARSEFLIKALNISETELPEVTCSELEDWLGQIKPYKATLIYATDFMGNPSSMFGHTLLRLDPKNQKQLNLISYAVNYAATVEGEQSWSYAWKGLTGQYPGEYSLMPYYRKVKEYGDLESRDLWEYELNLTEQETQFLVKHIWELKQVKFPYYFINDNCAYRLLGLIDLVRPELNVQQQFKLSAIPMQTLKEIDHNQLIADVVYRPALETQLNAQSKQHGHALAKVAHYLSLSQPQAFSKQLDGFDPQDQAKILEMAYDDLYLQLNARKVDAKQAEPKLRQLLILRSQLSVDKQRAAVKIPKIDPVKSHDASQITLSTGQLQNDSFFEISSRAAYHDLMDPQGGYRIGTQLKFLDASLQYRDHELKLDHFELLAVNAYNPITAFKTPLSWGFNLGWKQEAQHQGEFSDQHQHGVFNLNTQFGFSVADADRQHLCFAQIQNHIQAGKDLDRGWRVGLGPTLGCQNIWTEKWMSVLQLHMPYWEDQHQWQFNTGAQLQYHFNHQNAVRVHWQYQQQNDLDWNKFGLSLLRYF
ncbi:DUF4105 domain-containing protein [Acinetobacter wanghuae]|uniref:DUF4105 domain-containing protein n=1 Tax=Acinetobacter wanghuae TaxID=2662362 RepID=A0A5Q0P0T0_9GAMM|nr:DUF4105 domain-containing protein [Acinetobacter wanghuae]MQW92140.1 DUF4105 domain-containing protein [Acinetobacter wanghuae]QGA10689.1 DUF4105 domain-containing protein [Acinetobacter wanghuae]